MSQMMLFLLLSASLETLYMVAASAICAAAIGIPLGIILYGTRRGHLFENNRIHQILAFLINIMRSIPFIILMIAVIPFTRWLIGSSIGTNAAIVPLSLAAFPFMARLVESALLEINKGLIEAAVAMGANIRQIIVKVLLPEALPAIIQGTTLTIISLIGYSAMAGAVGGGGLGDMAIRYGYQRFNLPIMFTTIVIMIVLVQTVQFFGDKIAAYFLHRKG